MGLAYSASFILPLFKAGKPSLRQESHFSTEETLNTRLSIFTRSLCCRAGTEADWLEATETGHNQI
jgi:hypothetical protein